MRKEDALALVAPVLILLTQPPKHSTNPATQNYEHGHSKIVMKRLAHFGHSFALIARWAIHFRFSERSAINTAPIGMSIITPYGLLRQ